MFKYKTIPIFVPHWGCPQNCTFCNQRAITGVTEKMTVERAREIVEQCLAGKESGDHIEIGFFGGSFTGIPAEDQEAFLELAHEFVSAGLVDAIRLSTRPDYIDDAVIERLLHYGVKTIELGAQSMDDNVLSRCNRGHDAQTTRFAAEKINQAGISLGLQMMPGLPGDTEEISEKTAEEFIAMNPRCVRIYPTLVLKNTALAKEFLSGTYTPLTLEEAVVRCTMLYAMFQRHSIEIIRMGLLEVAEEGVLAGPYHPAFGELVMSRVFFDKMAKMLENHQDNSVCFLVHPKDISAAIGQKKENVNRLKESFSLNEIHFKQDASLTRGTITIDK